MNKKYFHGSVSGASLRFKRYYSARFNSFRKEGHLKRTHGGAISVQSEATIYDYAQRIVKHPEKTSDCPKVWANIPKQASIFDSSTTVEAAIRAMENSPIHAITNSSVMRYF